MSDTTNLTIPVPLGAPGLQQWSGYISEEWDKRLRGHRQRMSTYREMSEGSPTIGALLYAIEAVVRGAGYRIDPADDSPAAKDVAKFVEECVEDMQGAWGETVSELLTALVFGFSLSEIVYKRRMGQQDDERLSSAYDDGKIGWLRWAPRAQETIERWIFNDETGDAIAAVQIAPTKPRAIEIPMEALLHIAIRPRKQSPEGTSVIRNAFEPWYYYKHIQRIEAIGIERDLVGMPVLYIPASEYGDEAKRRDWMAVVQQVRVDEAGGLVFPSVYHPGTSNKAYEFVLASTGGQRQIDTDKPLSRYERLMLRSALADFFTLGDQGVGSFALGSTRADFFIGALMGLLDGLSDAISSQAVRRLIRKNAIDPKLTPKFAFKDPTKQDKKQFVEMMAILSGISVVDTENPQIREHIHQMLDLPMPKDGFEEVPAADQKPVPEPDPTANPADPTADPKNPVPPQFQASEVGTDGKLTDGALERARAAFDAVVGDKFQGLLEAEVTA